MTRAKTREGIDDTEAAKNSGLRRELVANELYEHAARLFAQKGFAGTSIQDIASSMGVSRQSLYYYVKSKDDLIEKLVREMIDLTGSLSELVVADPSVPAAERLHSLVRGVALQVAERPFRHRLITQSESAFTGELADEHRAARRRFARSLISLIEEGQRSGEFLEVDARTAAMTVAGMCNWIAWWFRGDAAAAHELADQLAETAVRGLRSPRRQRATAGTPQAALEMIRDGVQKLELMLDADEQSGE